MRGSRVLMGSRLFSAFVRPTFYRQFVGGDTGAELKNTADRLSESGLRLMVCFETLYRLKRLFLGCVTHSLQPEASHAT